MTTLLKTIERLARLGIENPSVRADVHVLISDSINAEIIRINGESESRSKLDSCPPEGTFNPETRDVSPLYFEELMLIQTEVAEAVFGIERLRQAAAVLGAKIASFQSRFEYYDKTIGDAAEAMAETEAEAFRKTVAHTTQAMLAEIKGVVQEVRDSIAGEGKGDFKPEGE